MGQTITIIYFLGTEPHYRLLKEYFEYEENRYFKLKKLEEFDKKDGKKLPGFLLISNPIFTHKNYRRSHIDVSGTHVRYAKLENPEIRIMVVGYGKNENKNKNRINPDDEIIHPNYIDLLNLEVFFKSYLDKARRAGEYSSRRKTKEELIDMENLKEYKKNKKFKDNWIGPERTRGACSGQEILHFLIDHNGISLLDFLSYVRMDFVNYEYQLKINGHEKAIQNILADKKRWKAVPKKWEKCKKIFQWLPFGNENRIDKLIDDIDQFFESSPENDKDYKNQYYVGRINELQNEILELSKYVDKEKFLVVNQMC